MHLKDAEHLYDLVYYNSTIKSYLPIALSLASAPL